MSDRLAWAMLEAADAGLELSLRLFDVPEVDAWELTLSRETADGRRLSRRSLVHRTEADRYVGGADELLAIYIDHARREIVRTAAEELRP